MIKTIITFILVFGILVFIHELGHFLFAKRAGVFVREFAIGFGPQIYQKRYGETLYTLRMLPLGGYVMMAGDDEETLFEEDQLVYLEVNKSEKVENIYLADQPDLHLIPFYIKKVDVDEKFVIEGYWPENEELQEVPIEAESYIVPEDSKKMRIVPKSRQYPAAKLMDRFLINIAGPLFNFLLAIVVFTLVAFSLPGVPASEARIGKSLEGSPAEQAHLEVGDQILSVENHEISSWGEMIEQLQDRGGKETQLEVEKADGQMEKITITPETKEAEDGTKRGQIGVQLYLDKSIKGRLLYGIKQTGFIIVSVFAIIRSMITGALGLDQLGGPIAIFQATGQVAQSSDLTGILGFLGFLSVNLGAMNLLPIPGLDGGKILLLVIEAIRKKPISKDKEYAITLIGVICILLLMLLVTWQDISRLFSN